MARILAIDPGNEKSAYVLYNMLTKLPEEFGIEDNEDLLARIGHIQADDMAIEMVASYGMAVGKTVFDTCVYIGRFVERWIIHNSVPPYYIYRKDVKMCLCGSMRAKDANIRQAIIDRYPAIGGGKIPQIGTKKRPGLLHGVSKDIWSALAVAITYEETR